MGRILRLTLAALLFFLGSAFRGCTRRAAEEPAAKPEVERRACVFVEGPDGELVQRCP